VLSLVRRSPTDCGVSEYDLLSLKIGRPWPTGAVAPWQKKIIQFVSAQNVHILINVTRSEKLNFKIY